MAISKQPDAVPTDQAQPPATAVESQGLTLARFDGSFAPASRPEEKRKLPWYADREYFLASWLSPFLWRAAFIELVGTASLIYISGMIAATLFSYETKQIGAYIGLSSAVLIPLFIYSTAAPTGGHLNPLITFSVFLSGLCPLPRAVLYLCAQTLGAALAGGVLLGVWGHERAKSYYGGGCFYDTTYISEGQVFLNEIFGSWTLLFLAFGLGLDPRQALLYGPRLGPMLVGLSLGLLTFATSGAVPGYAGAQMHPGRCFAFGVAKRDMSGQWIWWFGPATAAILMAVMYAIVPPASNFKGPDTRSTEPSQGDVV